jgi:hypothetical protein
MRNDIIGEFSTFCTPLDRNGYIRDQWQVDPGLARSLEILVADTDFAIDAWARYFFLTLRQSDRDLLESVLQPLVEQAPEPNRAVLSIHCHLLAQADQPRVREFWRHPDRSRQFLTAHLQKTCWFAAKKVYHNQIVPLQLIGQFSLEDCFQIVDSWAHQSDQLLKSFQLTRPSIQIKTYAEQVLANRLKKHIQKLAHLAPESSDWGVLRYVSESELLAALRSRGLRSPALSQAALLWQSFKHHYKTRQAGKNQLPPPSNTQLQEMGDRYEQQRSRHPLSEPLQLHAIIPLLHSYAEAVRAYRRSDVMAQKMQQDNEDQTPDPLDVLMQAEQTELVKSIVELARSTIEQQFSQQPVLVQQVLQLELGLELIQADIVQLLGAQLGIQKQYQLARLIGRYKKPLLQAFVQALQQAHPDLLPLDKSTDALINQLKAAFEDYLAQHCQCSFYPGLAIPWQPLSPQQQLLLLLHHRQKLDATTIAARLQIANAESEIDSLTQMLCSQLQQWIETTWQLDLSQGKTTIARLRSFTERWLEIQATLNREDKS